ncbi:DUF1828 domain-containing protein [Halobaculum lipolyticum]|uniref:DUF1828 domain-containing protein n=1 Tax=Halobaculum lipolyticum TaxID=3032001 RepID=A0ABD5W9B6_9EURY|nr:DUF1828 domain-containing protein [Halobaculum sp. DT31]
MTVPLERSDRDAITLWVKQQGEKYRISDEGETYGMLYLSNINLSQERRADRLNTIKSRFGLDEAKQQVVITTDEEHLGARMWDAIQAVQSISYLSYTRQQYTSNDFRNDVGEYFTENGITYTRNKDVTGASKDHVIDFNIQHQPIPTYVEAVHAENESSAESMADRIGFKWTDVRQMNSEIHTVSVLDDESGEYNSSTVKILENYSDDFVYWSDRETKLASAVQPSA